jgi:hypothetical protein
MSDLDDADEVRTVHIRSQVGTLSWQKIAARLPEATELTKRRYIEAITLYVSECEHQLRMPRQAERKKSKSLESLWNAPLRVDR